MFRLTIQTDNAAFGETNAELARILRELADKIDTNNCTSPHGWLTDINGAHIGDWQLYVWGQ